MRALIFGASGQICVPQVARLHDAGWHTLHDGERVTSFPVRAVEEAPGLVRAAMRDATLALAARSDSGNASSGPAPSHPGPRWPWLLAWLGVAAALWWLERSRRGQGT